VDQISGTPTDAPSQTQGQDRPSDATPSSEPPGFRSRGQARRRARFLRKARELAYRDLGGLVFSLHRFGQRNDALVLAKLTTLGRIDTELRGLEDALQERRPVTVLREAGITACARCAAIHSSEDSFCPNCGMSMGRHVDLPIAGAPATPLTPARTDTQAPTPATVPEAAPAPVPEAVPAAAAPPSSPAASDLAASDPVRHTATAGASDPAGAATGSSAPKTGRSPAPRSTSGTSPAKRSRARSASTEEDSPTEIIRPPTSGS
jgi:hypothetical protein